MWFQLAVSLMVLLLCGYVMGYWQATHNAYVKELEEWKRKHPDA